MLKKAQYVLLTGKMSPSSPHFSLYKNVYKLWSQTWKKTFTDVGSPEAFSADDFYRQDCIPVITNGDEPMAAHFYTFFNTENPAALDHHYFEIFPDKAMQLLESRSAKQLMSMEFLTVNSSYRRSILGFSLAEVLISLGANIMTKFNVDAAVGVAIKAARVDELAQKMNYQIIVDEARRGNLICCLMAGFAGTKDLGVHPDQDLYRFVNHLWETRQNGAFETYNSKQVA